MDQITTDILLFWLFVLLALSAFFSSSETGMMRVNRYRLKSMVNSDSKKASSAKRVLELLSRPDRLLGLILIGNNFVNFVAATIATILAERLWGNTGLLLAPIILTVLVLIFSEVSPKTLAALYPEKIAFPSSFILKPLMKLFYPLVFLINSISNGLLRLFGITGNDLDDDKVNPEELRAVVSDAGPMIPSHHQKMLLNILDLESATVEDIMIPRREIIGIDLDDEWSVISEQLKHIQHTRVLVFEDDIDNLKGMLHARDLINLLTSKTLNKDLIIKALSEVYFIPEGTPLNTQLLNFQQNKQRIGAVVDEYGDIQGIVTLEDILEEIVGEFTTDLAAENPEIVRQKDKSLLIDGGIVLRDLNRSMKWNLPTNGPKTLNGLILEYLEFLPEEGTGFRIFGFPMVADKVDDNMLQWVRIFPELFDDNL